MNKKVTVVQGNDLLEGSYNLTIDELRLLSLALSKVDSKNPQPPIPYTLTALEFREAYQPTTSKAHSKLKDAAKNLQAKPIILYSLVNGELTGTEYPWFSMLQYQFKKDSAVKIVFSEFVRPYLYELAKNFTQVKFHYVAKLDSPFSVRLYYWLAKERNFDKSKCNTVTVVNLDIEWMKERVGLTGKYPISKDFKNRVIAPAVKLINRNTDLSVTYKTIRTGRYVTGYSFSYIEDKEPDLSDVTRPRLPRRPQIKKGSHEEGLWARECIEILLKYQNDLHVMQAKKLPREDAKKLIRYAKITGDIFLADEVKKAYSL